MRIACVVAAVVFSLFSYLQLNDLEQYGTSLWLAWVVGYAAVALISLRSARALMPGTIYWVGAGFALLIAALRVSAIDWDQPILYNEANPAGNEASGLLIVVAWLAFLGWRSRAPREAA